MFNYTELCETLWNYIKLPELLKVCERVLNYSKLCKPAR